MSNAIALQRRLSDVVEEYDQKMLNAAAAQEAFKKAGGAIHTASTIDGAFGGVSLDVGSVGDYEFSRSLLGSAWHSVYSGLQIEAIASANDKKRFAKLLEKPPAFTLQNIRETFGDYLLDPRGNILRGLAEVFCGLDPFYKSHDKVKIGVDGLPKRIILTSIGEYGYGWGVDRLKDVLNALAQYQRKSLITHGDIQEILKDEYGLLLSRGVRLRRFKNGNGHLFFEPDTLWDINRALAEYYGEVLADAAEEKPAQRQQSTEVSKDLQYYPTPVEVVERVLERLYMKKGERVLEPSCGCGRFMDVLRKEGAEVFGIEFDSTRVMESRKKGHSVLQANFLETIPTADYDRVVMNPPFYGKHYAKHVEHALKFLKPGGTLTAILPVTARYDHGLLQGKWEDLPVGSFRESGTNINTTILTITTPAREAV